MGRGESCEVTGPDGVIYRRGRRRPTSAQIEFEPGVSDGMPAVIVSALEQASVTGGQLNDFLADRNPAKIRIRCLQRGWEFVWGGVPRTFGDEGFEGERNAVDDALGKLQATLFGGRVDTHALGGTLMGSWRAEGTVKKSKSGEVQLEIEAEPAWPACRLYLQGMLLGQLEQKAAEQLRRRLGRGDDLQAFALLDASGELRIELRPAG